MFEHAQYQGCKLHLSNLRMVQQTSFPSDEFLVLNSFTVWCGYVLVSWLFHNHWAFFLYLPVSAHSSRTYCFLPIDPLLRLFLQPDMENHLTKLNHKCSSFQRTEYWLSNDIYKCLDLQMDSKTQLHFSNQHLPPYWNQQMLLAKIIYWCVHTSIFPPMA